jgi:hypothetical protein
VTLETRLRNKFKEKEELTNGEMDEYFGEERMPYLDLDLMRGSLGLGFARRTKGM